MRYPAGRGITQHGRQVLSGKKTPKCCFRMPREKLAQVLYTMAIFKIAAQQALDGIWHFARRATITHGTAKARVLSHGAAQTEIVSVLNSTVDLELFAFEPDIGDAVLAATVRAARDMQLQVLVKFGKALLQLFHQHASFGGGAGFQVGPERRR